MKYLLMIVCAIYLSACVSYIPPAERNIQGVRNVKLSQAQAMQRIERWLLDNEFAIANKSDNFIYATSDLKKLQQVVFDNWSGLKIGRQCLDCGGSSNKTNLMYESDNGMLNVSLVKIGDNSTDISVKLTGKLAARWGAAPMAYCTSTGVLEQLIFEAMDK